MENSKQEKTVESQDQTSLVILVQRVQGRVGAEAEVAESAMNKLKRGLIFILAVSWGLKHLLSFRHPHSPAPTPTPHIHTLHSGNYSQTLGFHVPSP